MDTTSLKSIVATPLGAPAGGPSPANAAGLSHRPGAGHLPQVECVKQGDKVIRLVVTCACGERIEIECLYPGVG